MNKFLSNLKKISGSFKKSRRVGRGYGSTGGHTAGRGNKGQNARSGGKRNIYFEGGQTPLVRRMPFKGGFKNHAAKNILSLNISDLAGLIDHKKDISPKDLVDAGLVSSKKFYRIKILGRGSLKKKVSLKGFDYSSTAKEKIEKAGGRAE